MSFPMWLTVIHVKQCDKCKVELVVSRHGDKFNSVTVDPGCRAEMEADWLELMREEEVNAES